jgi:HPt (histidine-containing phosphotransfer) domain-containing protein
MDATPTSAPDAVAAEETAVFDAVSFLARLTGDSDLAKTILAEFLAHLPKQLDRLAGSIAAGEGRQVEAAAHALHGACAAVSGDVVAEVAAAIEAAGKAGDLAAARSQFALLQAEATRLAETICAFPAAAWAASMAAL